MKEGAVGGGEPAGPNFNATCFSLDLVQVDEIRNNHITLISGRVIRSSSNPGCSLQGLINISNCRSIEQRKRKKSRKKPVLLD